MSRRMASTYLVPVLAVAVLQDTRVECLMLVWHGVAEMALQSRPSLCPTRRVAMWAVEMAPHSLRLAAPTKDADLEVV